MRTSWKFAIFSFCLASTVFAGLALAAAPGVAQETPVSVFAPILNLYRWMQSSTVWKWLMDWVNFFVLFGLLGKFLIPIFSKALDQGLSEIETGLNSEALEKKNLELELERLKKSLAGIDEEKVRILEDAKDISKKQKQMILEHAREQELKIFRDVEVSAGAYYERKLDDVKNGFVFRLIDSLNGQLVSAEIQPRMSGFTSRLVKEIGVSDEK